MVNGTCNFTREHIIFCEWDRCQIIETRNMGNMGNMDMGV